MCVQATQAMVKIKFLFQQLTVSRTDHRLIIKRQTQKGGGADINFNHVSIYQITSIAFCFIFIFIFI